MLHFPWQVSGNNRDPHCTNLCSPWNLVMTNVGFWYHSVWLQTGIQMLLVGCPVLTPVFRSWDWEMGGSLKTLPPKCSRSISGLTGVL